MEASHQPYLYSVQSVQVEWRSVGELDWGWDLGVSSPRGSIHPDHWLIITPWSASALTELAG